MAALGDVAKMTIADHTRHDSMEAIAESILADAPERFALAGLSMGGYIACEIVRQAPQRVMKLALLDTGSRADTPERREQRLALITLAEREGTKKAQEALLPVLIHKASLTDKTLVDIVLQMGVDTGTDAFKRQQMALMQRSDNLPLLTGIKCPTLVIVGREDAAGTGGGDRSWHSRREAGDHPGLRTPLHAGTARRRQPRNACVADEMIPIIPEFRAAQYHGPKSCKGVCAILGFGYHLAG
jgi:pimeloyl-ACP methyl ester carboxylesterase